MATQEMLFKILPEGGFEPIEAIRVERFRFNPDTGEHELIPLPDDLTTIRPPHGLWQAKYIEHSRTFNPQSGETVIEGEWVEAGGPPSIQDMQEIADTLGISGMDGVLADGMSHMAGAMGISGMAGAMGISGMAGAMGISGIPTMPLNLSLPHMGLDAEAKAAYAEAAAKTHAAINAAAFLFTKAAEAGQISDDDIAAHGAVFPLWVENTPHSVGCLRRCPVSGGVYRCIDPPAVSERARNSRIAPSEAVRFWERVGDVEVRSQGSEVREGDDSKISPKKPED